MKRLITSLLLVLLIFGAQAQGQSFEASTFNLQTDSLAESLVNLAMNNPRIQYTINLARQFDEQYRKSKVAWLNAISVQGNLNEYSIKDFGSTDPRTANLFPRYNIGVNIPLGLFSSTSRQTKADYFKSQAMANEVDVERRSVRKEVLTSFQNYKMNKSLLDMEQQVVNDWHIIFLRTEERFRKGEITLESFYSSTRIYNDEMNKVVAFTTAVANSSAVLEELIGMNLQDAIQMYNAHKLNNK